MIWTGYKAEFNNQMITLAETILLNAYALKRVLVLTGFMELGDYSKDVNASDGLDYTVDVKHHVLHEVAFALDVNQSMRSSGLVPGVDVITIEELKKVCDLRGMHVEAHGFMHDFDTPNKLDDGILTYHVKPYRVMERMWPTSGSPLYHPIREIEDLVFHDARAYVYDSFQTINPWKAFSNVTVAPILVVDYLFYSSGQFNPSYAPHKSYDYFGVLAGWSWSQKIMGYLDDLARKHFGGSAKAVDYIALHWRRGYHVATDGDNHRDSKSTAYTHKLVANLLLNVSETFCPTCPIYIASNVITKDDIFTLKKLIGTGQEMYSLLIDPPNMELNTLSRVEMAICTHASVFIPTTGSTWSANVLAMRGVRISGPPDGPEELIRTIKEGVQMRKKHKIDERKQGTMADFYHPPSSPPAPPPPPKTAEEREAEARAKMEKREAKAEKAEQEREKKEREEEAAARKKKESSTEGNAKGAPPHGGAATKDGDDAALPTDWPSVPGGGRMPPDSGGAPTPQGR